MGSGIHAKTKMNIIKILNLLRENGEMHLRGISTVLEINSGTVFNIIETYLNDFVEVRYFEYAGFRAKLIKLKEGKEMTTLNGVLKHYRVRKVIKNRS